MIDKHVSLICHGRIVPADSTAPAGDTPSFFQQSQVESEDPEPFGILLKHFRIEQRLTQQELAERALLSARAISDLERGVNRSARQDTLHQLIAALQLSDAEQRELKAAARAHRRLPRRNKRSSGGTRILAVLRASMPGVSSAGAVPVAGDFAVQASRFRRLVTEIAGSHDGQLLELSDRDALVSFLSAGGAVQAALELHNRCVGKIMAAPSCPRTVAIALDIMESTHPGDFRETEAFHLLNHLCSLAEAGGILASDSLIHLLHDRRACTLVNRGWLAVRGTKDPRQVIQIVPRGQDHTTDTGAVESIPLPRLPGEPMSRDACTQELERVTL